MNIGELFLNLGIKGSEKTVGALSNVKKGLGEVSSMSIEAKAGILAALYGFERLTAASNQAGTGMTNFSATTGLAAKQLQQYQYAARQMGVSNDEVEGTFKSLQKTITSTLLNGDAPKGLARLAQLTGGIGREDLARFQKNPAELLQRLQTYAQREKNAGLRNTVLESFGVGAGMNAALTRGAFTPGQLAKAPTYSDGEIKSLDKANIAWSNLGNKIEMAVGHLNSRHGLQLVEDISKITTAVITLTEKLLTLGEKLKIFDGISKVLNFVGDAIESKPGTALGEDHLEKKIFKKLGEAGKSLMSAFGETSADAFGAASDRPAWDGRKSAVPSLPAPRGGPSNVHNNEVNQTVIFQGHHDAPKKTSDALKKGASDFVKQNPSKNQGA